MATASCSSKDKTPCPGYVASLFQSFAKGKIQRILFPDNDAISIEAMVRGVHSFDGNPTVAIMVLPYGLVLYH